MGKEIIELIIKYWSGILLVMAVITYIVTQYNNIVSNDIETKKTN